MEMQRRQFCLTVTAGMATTVIPGRQAEARVWPKRGHIILFAGAALVFIGMAVGVVGLVTLNPFVAGAGGFIAYLGVVTIMWGALYCVRNPKACSTSRACGDVSGVSRGGDEAPAGLGEEDDAQTIGLQLPHVAVTNPVLQGATGALNRMIDAHNRLRGDISEGSELGGALAELRQSIGQVRAELGGLAPGGYSATAAVIAEGRRRMRADGFPAAQADYLRGCGFTEAAIHDLRQQILQVDLSSVEGKSVVELLDESAAGVPDAADFGAPGPLVPIPEPGVHR